MYYESVAVTEETTTVSQIPPKILWAPSLPLS